MPVIAFASSKGGAGKTTSAIVLGTELAAAGATVTLIDADPAKRLVDWSQAGTVPDRMEVVSSGGEKHILDEIEEATGKSAFVVVDLEGSASQLSSRAMSSSDLVIIPTGEEQQDAKAALDTLAEVKLVGRSSRRDIPAVILLARVAPAVKSRLERYIAAELREKGRVFSTELVRRTAYSSLHNSGGGLRELDRSDVSGVEKAIENATKFADEVITILEEIRNA